MVFAARFWSLGLAVPAAVLLAACGGGSGTSSVDTGRLSLYVTDAPVDDADAVVVAFTGVQVKPAEGDPISLQVCAEETGAGDENETNNSGAQNNESAAWCENGVRKIDLLKYRGMDAAPLVEDEELPAGRYEWIRLEVLTSRTSADDSYITIEGTPRPLWVPSGDQTGLKLVQGFTVPAGGSASFTIDFDLRKSIANPQGPFLDTYFLRPALRLVDNTLTGHLEGNIAGDLIEGTACLAADPPGVGVIYVFQPDGDISHDTDPEDAVTSATVDSIDEGVDNISYSYKIGFLSAEENGTEYLVQLWCDTTVGETVDGVALAEGLATILPGETAILDFSAGDAIETVNGD